MKQEDKELLIKDLCARLPYGVKISYRCNHIYILKSIHKSGLIVIEDTITNITTTTYIEYIKPYLFPLSSMTEEQKKEISERYNYHNYYGVCIEITYHSEGYWDNDTSCNLQDYLWLEDWFNKNHFDYRCLIPMNLAIDATNLNIY